MSLAYDIDLGYGIRIVERAGEGDRPAGFVVEIHFYKKSKAVEYVVELIRRISRETQAGIPWDEKTKSWKPPKEPA